MSEAKPTPAATGTHEFERKLREAIDAGEFVSLTFTEPVRRAETGNAESAHPDRVTVRPVEVRGGRRFQFAFRSGKAETHENLNDVETLSRVMEFLELRFARAKLKTATADVSIRVQSNGELRVTESSRDRSVQGSAHNRRKQHLIPEGVPCRFLEEIGVMTNEGKVRAAKAKKFKQINRFLELVDDVIRGVPGDAPLHVVDFGCGKSYLTFALDHLIRTIRGRDVRIAGLDREKKVIESCRDVARRLECPNLDFQVGDVAHYEAATPVDLVVSLHACDTATDDALAKAVGWNTRAILAVPCCQHDLSANMQPADLPSLTRHGILRERFAALATDAMRAELLEVCGYRTQVVEFIDMEHTAKNLLIRAVRRKRPNPKSAERLAAYRAMKAMLGVDSTPLEEALRERIAYSSKPET